MIFRNPVRTMASSEKAATWKEEKQRRLDLSLEERRKVGSLGGFGISDLLKLLLFFRNIFVMKIL